MVHVINATGLNIGMTTAIDLSPYLEDDIAVLIGARTLVFNETCYATMSATGDHTHSVEVEAAHTHLVEEEAAHIHDAGASLPADAAGGADHSHNATVGAPAAGAFTPTTDAAGAYAPTTQAEGAWTLSAPTVSELVGPVLTNQVVRNNGYLDAAATDPGAGSVALTGRRQIHLGAALSVNDFLELRVLYFQEVAGIF